jgi:hypothetical protein
MATYYSYILKPMVVNECNQDHSLHLRRIEPEMLM